MAKKLMALVLAVLMAVSLLPMPALADGGDLSAFPGSGSYKLGSDTELKAPLTVTGDTTIDLNGKNLKFSLASTDETNQSAIVVEKGSLTLKGKGTVDMSAVSTGISLAANTKLIVSEDVSLTGRSSAIKTTAGAANVEITVNTTGTISAENAVVITDSSAKLTITAGTVSGTEKAIAYGEEVTAKAAKDILAEGSKLYIDGKAATEDQLAATLDVSKFVVDDGNAPALSDLTGKRTSEAEGSVSFTASKAGTYYYRLDGETEPAAGDLFETEGAALVKGENTLALKELAEGAHTVYMAVKDAYNTNTTVYEFSVPALLAAPNGLEWNGSKAKWNPAEGAKSYEVQLYLDGSAYKDPIPVNEDTETGDISGVMEADGAYTFKVRAIGENTVGVWSDMSGQTVRDTKAPTVSVKENGVSRTAKDTASIVFVSDEAGTLCYVINDDTADVFTSGQTLELAVSDNNTLTLTGLTDSAAVAVRCAAKDAAGNQGSEFTVNIPLYLAAPDGLAWEGTTAKWNKVDGATAYHYQLLDGTKNVVIEDNTNSEETEETSHTFEFGQSGSYTFRVQAVAGEITGAMSEESPAITVDLTAPALSAPASLRSDAASGIVTFRSDEAGKVYYIVGGDTPTKETVLASEKTQDIAAGDNSVAISGIADAKAVNVYLVAVDGKNNASDVVTISVPAFLAKPATLTWVNGTTAMWSAVDGAAAYNIQLLKDGAVFGDVIVVNGGSVTTADLASHMTEDGVYTFKVQATAAGTQSEWSDASATTYKRDTQKPTVKAEPSKRIDEKTADIFFTASEDGTYYYTVGAANAAAPAADQIADDKNPHGGCTNAKTTIRLKDISDKEARKVFVVVRDKSGNLSDVYTITVPAYTATPTATPTPAPTAAPTATPAPTAAPTTYTVTLQGGTGYTIKANSGSSSPVNAGGSFSFTVTPNSGYVKGNGFAVKANGTTLQANNYGVYTINNINANQTVSVSGIVKSSTNGGTLPAAPAITTTTLAAATMGKEYRQQITATGGTPITWSYSGTLPDGMTLAQNTGILSGTPTQEGSFRFAVKATNSTGFSTKQLTLVVSGSEYTVTKGANTEWTQGGDKGFDLSGSGKGSFTVKVDGATVPTGKYTASADGATVTLKPEYLDTLAAGSHTVTLVYADGSAKAKFTIKKQDKTVAPTVSSQPANAEAGEGSSAVFSVTASGTTPLLCQWQVDKNDGNGWEDITGAVNASYTVDAVTAEQNGWKYRCVITNAAGSVESNAATLTVKEAIGDVKKNDDTQKNDTGASKLGRILLIVGISVAVVALGVGLYLYFRRRNASRYY